MTMSDRVAVFRDGRIEQLGSPLAVYDRPANRFVAEFIGDSNFFSGRADPARPGVVELDKIGAVRVAPGATAAGEVDVMIRPERLRLAAAGEADNVLDMLIDDAINYGDSILVIGTTRGLPLRARLVGHAPDMLQRGANLRLSWSPADARVLARG
jgi:ABC-type Fe3+/spermidine/putrescine transport system ATPase subunit